MTIAKSILYLHAVAENELPFSVCYLFACEEIHQLGLALLSALQLQLVVWLLNLYFLFVVQLHCLFNDQPQVFVIVFLRNRGVLDATVPVDVLETFYWWYVRYFRTLHDWFFSSVAQKVLFAFAFVNTFLFFLLKLISFFFGFLFLLSSFLLFNLLFLPFSLQLLFLSFNFFLLLFFPFLLSSLLLLLLLSLLLFSFFLLFIEEFSLKW